MKQLTKVFFTTGGTAGHIFPAVSVIEELQKENPEVQVAFIGSEQGQEASIMHQYGIPFIGLPTVGIMGKKGFLYKIRAMFSLAKSIWRSYRLCKKEKPQCIFAFGGFASVPCALGGKLAGIPVVLHEQNIIPGMANKLIARFATAVCTTFEETKRYFSAKNIVYTGNPVRSSFLEKSRSVVSAREQSAPKTSYTLLILGGSLGAKAINSLIVAIAEKLIQNNIQIIHQTGKADYENVYHGYSVMDLQDKVTVQPFFEDMCTVYTQADLIVCRAGASTLTELTHMGLPAIAIPFPNAIYDHQWHNARSFEEKKALICVRENELSAEKLYTLIKNTLNEEKLQNMRKAMYALAVDDASKKILNVAKTYIL